MPVFPQFLLFFCVRASNLEFFGLKTDHLFYVAYPSHSHFTGYNYSQLICSFVCFT